MPTPVSTVRKCLTEESARILDDAVAVARRRFHRETTSLHAVSALLSLPTSLLREACSRARSPACSSRFQFRALDLCVNVSLDRLQSSKSDGNPPPVANSFFAAIKRSQGFQRRQPETTQQHSSNSIYSVSSIKVELQNFVVSILDDPSVSRVLGDAGFDSTDIRLSILHPPVPPLSPTFLSNLTHSRSSIDFEWNETCTKVGEILAKSTGRNPVLVGAGAGVALQRFLKRIAKGETEGVLPREIADVDVICVEKEIIEFLSAKGSKAAFEMKIEAMCSALDSQLGHGVVVNIGELKVFVEGGAAVKPVMSKLSILLKIYKKKMWLIGAALYGTYQKFLDKFPLLEVEWDLHPLSMTTKKSSKAESNNKSRVLSSFVPLGGFFSSPSDYTSPPCIINKPFTRCSSCNKEYTQELSIIKSVGSSVSVADEHSSTSRSWLQLASSSSNTRNVTTEIRDEKAEPSAKVLWLQRKWDDMCKSLHQEPDLVVPCTTGNQSTTETLNDVLVSNIVPGVLVMLQKLPSQEQNVKAPLGFTHKSDSCNLNLSPDHASSSSNSSVITDLGLGTPAPQELKNFKLIVQKLTEKIPWQVEACNEIGQIIPFCRGGNGGRCDTWIGLTGPDKIGKVKIAEALAELVFGSKEHLIVVDFSDAKRTNECHSVFDTRIPEDFYLRDDRKTMADYIAWELSRKPSLVILLQNVDNITDSSTQIRLLHAIQTGAFLDSYGSETSMVNTIFLIQCNSTEEDQDLVNFSEHSILEALSCEMKILMERVDTSSNKRKQKCSIVPFRHKKPKDLFDLNMPVQDTISDNSRTWLEDFIGKVDRKVTFKAVNFDPLANKLFHKMTLSLPKTSEFRLEVNQEVMSQILAAYLFSDGESSLDDWINGVFGKACGEAHRIYSPNKQTSLKLVSCPGLAIDKQAPGIRLPMVINLG